MCSFRDPVHLASGEARLVAALRVQARRVPAGVNCTHEGLGDFYAAHCDFQNSTPGEIPEMVKQGNSRAGKQEDVQATL